MRKVIAVSTLAMILAPALAVAVDFPLNGTTTTIGFIGTKPGGKHVGGFKSVTGTASVDGADLTTLKIKLEIDMTSLFTDNGNLTNHLKSPDFFGVKSNPKSKFVSTKVEKSDDGYKITGKLTMLKKTNEISFPATIKIADGTLTIDSAFTIDKTDWGMTFGKGKIDNEVKLTVKVKAGK